MLLCSRLKLSVQHAVLPPRAQASSGIILRPRVPYPHDDDSANDAKLAWKAWMKVDITVSEGLSCDVLAWWRVGFR